MIGNLTQKTKILRNNPLVNPTKISNNMPTFKKNMDTISLTGTSCKKINFTSKKLYDVNILENVRDENGKKKCVPASAKITLLEKDDKDPESLEMVGELIKLWTNKNYIPAEEELQGFYKKQPGPVTLALELDNPDLPFNERKEGIKGFAILSPKEHCDESKKPIIDKSEKPILDLHISYMLVGPDSKHGNEDRIFKEVGTQLVVGACKFAKDNKFAGLSLVSQINPKFFDSLGITEVNENNERCLNEEGLDRLIKE